MPNIKVTSFKKGHIPWNKGKKGVQISTRKGKKLLPLSSDTKEKISIAMSKENHWNWKNGKPKCLDCGKELSNYNNKKCNSCKGMKQENSYRWIIDRTKLAKRQERNDMAYKEWRKLVWLRDNFKCKINNSDCSGRIEAHHILGWSDYPELRYEINNGITLCHAHHPKRRAEEKRLIPKLQELVSVSIGNICQIYKF